MHFGFNNFGISNELQQDFRYNNGHDINEKFLSGFILYSNNSEFTPAQKNLIAIALQKLGNSKNSIFQKGKELSFSIDENFDENTPLDKFFTKIANWAKDINTKDEKTQILLSTINKLKKGECVEKDTIIVR